MTDDKDFISFEPNTPQYKKLKTGEFTSLTLRIYVTVNYNVFKMEYGNKLNPEHSLRTPRGIKGTRQKVIVTHNPSEIDQNQLLLVRFPNLRSDDVKEWRIFHLTLNYPLPLTRKDL